MRPRFGFVAVCIFSCLHSFAEHTQFKLVGEPTSIIKVGQKEIPIHGEARVFYEGAPQGGVPVFLTGAGVRRKKITFVDVDCYVIASYVGDQNSVDPGNPMNTIAGQPVKALFLTMVRDISAQLIRSSFEDSLDANNVDLTKPGIKDLLSKISFDMPEGKSVSFLGIHERGLEAVHVETTMGDTFTSRDEALSWDFWSSWFGIPADNHMANLKKKLIGK